MFISKASSILCRIDEFEGENSWISSIHRSNATTTCRCSVTNYSSILSKLFEQNLPCFTYIKYLEMTGLGRLNLKISLTSPTGTTTT